MRKLAAIILTLAMILTLSACNTGKTANASQSLKASSNPSETSAETEAGSTLGNIMNKGYATLYDGEIYFANGMRNQGLSDGKLYVADLNGKNVVKLSDDRALYVNVVGDWVYYCNLDVMEIMGDIYRIKTDGSKKEELYSHKSCDLNIVGDWVYFSDYSLRKMKTDGTEVTTLDEVGTSINVVGDWIYYLRGREEGDNVIDEFYKIKTDGTQRTKIGEEDFCLGFTVAGDWIYYLGEYPGNLYISKLYKIGVNGGDKTTVGDIGCRSFNIVGDWIYFTQDTDPSDYGASDEIYKMKLDGTSVTKLSDIQGNDIYHLNIAGDWIYFNQNFDREKSTEQYKIKTDGTGYSKAIEQ